MNPVTVKNETLGESYEFFRHESGLSVYVIPKERSHTFGVLGVRFGAADRVFRTENDSDPTVLPDGVAHFLEHKLFEDENGIDAFTRFAETGANANAFTSAEDTCYLFSATDMEEENLRILLDFVTHPYFSEASIAKEQGIIGEEIDMDADQPGTLAYYNLMSAMFHEHPVRRRICGTRESISKITPELLYRCTDLFYRPSNMALVVCGRMTVDQVRSICDELLPARTQEPDVERIFPEEPASVRTPLITAEAEVAQPIVELGYKAPHAGSTEECLRIAAANEITSTLLFGRSGEFYNRLYEDGLISDRFNGGFVQSPRLGYSYVLVSAYCDEPERLREEVTAEIERRKTDFFSREEFEIARRVAYTNKLFAFDSTEETAFLCLEHWGIGSDHLRYAESLANITYEEAFSIYKKTFLTEQCAMSVVCPKGSK